MSEHLTNSIGDRITYCRSSLQLTRKELIEEWKGASLPTLSRWELGMVKIPIKKIPSLVHYFYEKGLIVSDNWIINGAGAPPFVLQDNTFDELDFDSFAQEELLSINRKQKNFIFGQVKNNLISPHIKYGDYIGGKVISCSLDSTLRGEMVFVKLKTGLVAGFLENLDSQIVLKNLDNHATENYKLDIVESAGKIQWIIRRP